MQIVDLATLTGACVVALGPSIAGIYACASSFLFSVYVMVRLPFNVLVYTFITLNARSLKIKQDATVYL